MNPLCVRSSAKRDHRAQWVCGGSSELEFGASELDAASTPSVQILDGMDIWPCGTHPA